MQDILRDNPDIQQTITTALGTDYIRQHIPKDGLRFDTWVRRAATNNEFTTAFVLQPRRRSSERYLGWFASAHNPSTDNPIEWNPRDPLIMVRLEYVDHIIHALGNEVPENVRARDFPSSLTQGHLQDAESVGEFGKFFLEKLQTQQEFAKLQDKLGPELSRLLITPRGRVVIRQLREP